MSKIINVSSYENN